MTRTSIEWTDETWNPVTGCTKVSQGCKHCYAERLAPKVFAGQKVSVPGRAFPGVACNVERPRRFTDVRCHPERLEAPLRWRKPRRVFVNSMSDLFHEAVPDEFIGQVFEVMAKARHHTFQVLTKRPRLIAKRLGPQGCGFYAVEGPVPCPLSNVWLGVSCEDQATADERIPLLLQAPAAVRFVSCEPLLGPIRFNPNDLSGAMRELIGWVIVGGESGPKARPMHPDWARSLRDQCVAAGVPFLFKQWGEYVEAVPPHGFDAEGLHPADEKAGYVEIEGHLRAMLRVGKKAAGRVLDGRTWDEFPQGAP